LRVSGRLQTNSSEVIRATVLDGQGIGYSPSWLFTEELASGEVQALLTDWLAPEMPMQLVSPPARRGSAKVRLFGDLVAGALAEGAGSRTRPGQGLPAKGPRAHNRRPSPDTGARP
jgi:DNA-binding transcriptional LysR family regulator